MNESNRERVNEFLRSLEEALARSGRQSEEIAEEVQADLEAHVERLQGEGRSESEAVELALRELGNPYELAHKMSGEVPPFGGKALTIVRYVLASGVILWTVLLLWHFRAWSYGFSPVAIALAVLFHLPAVLLLWPRIVWRKNWLFGLIPAGLALLVAIIVSLGGVESSSELSISLPVDGGGPVIEAPEGDASHAEDSKTKGTLVALALAAVAAVLLLSMQQRSQRRRAILSILLVVGGVEVAFQIEEAIFRQDRAWIREYVAKSLRENGAYPTEEEFKSERSKLASKRVAYWKDEDGYVFFWSRPLGSGFSIVYASQEDRVSIQD